MIGNLPRRRLRIPGLLLLMFAFSAPVISAEETGAEKVIDRLHETLITVMKASDSLDFDARYELLKPVLQDCFDLAFMAEKSVGRHWKKASEAEKRTLVDTFGRYTISNYAGRFVGYSGQHFETVDQEPALRETVLVRTRLVDPSDEPIQLNYRLRSLDGQWKIIDVYFNGTVSELALRRSEYAGLIKRNGMGGLLSALDEKIADLKTSDAEES